MFVVSRTASYKITLVRLSVCPSVCLSVCSSVRPSVSKFSQDWIILSYFVLTFRLFSDFRAFLRGFPKFEWISKISFGLHIIFISPHCSYSEFHILHCTLDCCSNCHDFQYSVCFLLFIIWLGKINYPVHFLVCYKSSGNKIFWRFNALCSIYYTCV